MRRTEGLSARELDVLELALLGLTHQEIAGRLFLSVDTVKTHFRRAYSVLLDDDGEPARGALHAVAVALKRGWMVYDERTRTITRPPDRPPLPAYVDTEAQRPPVPEPRTLADRRRQLGW